EVVSSRVQTPNSVLFEIHVTRGNDGLQRPNVTFFDFSDRPQFLAQDAQGRLLYSTRPTSAAQRGTIRIADRQPGWAATEVKLLLSDRVFESDTTRFAVAHVDSMRAFHFPNGDDRIIIYDHAPGFPTQIVSSGLLPVRDALQALTDS